MHTNINLQIFLHVNGENNYNIFNVILNHSKIFKIVNNLLLYFHFIFLDILNFHIFLMNTQHYWNLLIIYLNLTLTQSFQNLILEIIKEKFIFYLF